MSLSSKPSLREQTSPILSARLTELVQYLNAPLLGRLTDEQRALSLAIARRLVSDIALRIDNRILTDQLWADWLTDGIPANTELATACFARAEEHRWRVASENTNIVAAPLAVQKVGMADCLGHSGLHHDAPELAPAYLALQVADRRRFTVMGYPTLSIADINDDLYRHLLNEIARWRLGEVSRDRVSSAGLGEAVRHAWSVRANEDGLDACGRVYYDRLRAADRLYVEANQSLARQDWSTFIALAAVAQGRRYSEMALNLLSQSSDVLAKSLAPLRLSPVNFARLEASLAALPLRAVQPEPKP